MAISHQLEIANKLVLESSRRFPCGWNTFLEDLQEPTNPSMRLSKGISLSLFSLNSRRQDEESANSDENFFLIRHNKCFLLCYIDAKDSIGKILPIQFIRGLSRALSLSLSFSLSIWCAEPTYRKIISSVICFTNRDRNLAL